ncbi:MAG: hypothetical protein ACI8W0_000770, partial [Flavobacterium sp.]
MKKIIIAAVISLVGLAGYAQNTTAANTIATPKEEIKASRLNFNAGLETSHLWRGLVINDG